MDMLDLATFFCLCVVKNLPLAFAAFVVFVAFVAFGMLPSTVVHDAAHCDILLFLSMNNLISSSVGKLIDICSTACPSVLWTVSSTLLSWKPLYLCHWGADEHLWCLETWQHSWQAICQSKTKMNLRTDLQHTCVIDHEGCAISAGRSRDWLPRLCKAQSGLSGERMTTGTAQCTVQPGCWLLELRNAQSQLVMVAVAVTALHNFLGH